MVQALLGQAHQTAHTFPDGDRSPSGGELASASHCGSSAEALSDAEQVEVGVATS